ncbi:MAG: hypothetical protein O7C98_08405, partial [Planctomycetota bacterium]|nr:hypothetical protein [Planctomycetota bacterium]
MRRIYGLTALLVCVVLCLSGCRGGGGGGANTITYEITGNIKITNDCDGKLDSIPKKVEVWFELTNRAGNVGVYAHDTVDLRPDPASPGNPVKIGIFSAQA